MGEEFSFVIVGSGNMAETYAAVVGKLPGMRVAGVVSRSGRKPEGLTGEADVGVASSSREVGREFDAVILATPNGLHHQGAIEAAELGKHVLTEKVLDIRAESMDRMIRVCRDRDVRLGVAFQSRTHPDIRAIKRLLEAEQFGRVYAADLAVKYYRDQAYYDSAPYRGTRNLDGGGPFMQQAAHNVDMYCWYFGMPEKVVSSLGTFAHDIEVEDHGVALVRHADGMIGTISVSTAARPGFPATLTIHAERGTVIVENADIITWEMEGVENPHVEDAVARHDGATSAQVKDTAGHEEIVRDFVDACREGRDPMITGESARMATDLILRIYEADM